MAEPKQIEKASGGLSSVEEKTSKKGKFLVIQVGGTEYTVWPQTGNPSLFDTTNSLKGQYVDIEYTVNPTDKATYLNITTIQKGEKPQGYVAPIAAQQENGGVPEEVWEHKDKANSWLRLYDSSAKLVGQIAGYSELDKVIEITNKAYDELYKKVGQHPQGKIDSQPTQVEKIEPAVGLPSSRVENPPPIEEEPSIEELPGDWDRFYIETDARHYKGLTEILPLLPNLKGEPCKFMGEWTAQFDSIPKAIEVALSLLPEKK